MYDLYPEEWREPDPEWPGEKALVPDPPLSPLAAEMRRFFDKAFALLKPLIDAQKVEGADDGVPAPDPGPIGDDGAAWEAGVRAAAAHYTPAWLPPNGLLAQNPYPALAARDQHAKDCPMCREVD